MSNDVFCLQSLNKTKVFSITTNDDMYKCVLSAPEMISECFSLQHNIHTPAAGEQGHIQPGGQMSADT